MDLLTMITVLGLAAAGDGGVQAEIDTIRMEIQSIARSQAQGALDAERAAEIRAIVKDALADAGTRTMLQGQGGQDGPFVGDNFYRLDAAGTEISSGDGNFRFHLNVLMQLRFTWNDRPEQGETMGFENRRTEFIMDGHAFSKMWRYMLQITRPSGGSAGWEPEDAWVGRVFSPELQLKMGQFKPYFTREELASTAATTFADRSVLNDYFKASKSRGISLEWETDSFLWRTGYFDGITTRSPTTTGGPDYNVTRTTNLPWNNSLDIRWSAASRLDWKFSGTWKDTRDYTPWLDMKGECFTIGGAVAGEQADLDTNPWMFEATGDLLWKRPGVSVMAWGVWRRVQTTEGEADEWGALVQATAMLSERLGATLRYSIGDSGADSAEAYSQLSLIEGNLSYYFEKHLMKIQLDAGYSFDGLSSNSGGNGFASSSGGLLADVGPAGGSVDGQVFVRVQYQILF